MDGNSAVNVWSALIQLVPWAVVVALIGALTRMTNKLATLEERTVNMQKEIELLRVELREHQRSELERGI